MTEVKKTDGKVEHMIVSFSVNGEWFTDLCRSVWVEGRRMSAIKLLVEGMQGVDEDLALKILTGRKKFVGIDGRGHPGIKLLDDNTTHHLGIPLSLTYQIEMAEKKASETSALYHLMRYPWYHQFIETGMARKVMPSTSFMKRMGEGRWGRCSEEPLKSYKSFYSWIKETTCNFEKEGWWVLESVRSIYEKQEKIPESWTRYTTEQMIEMVDKMLDTEQDRLDNLNAYLDRSSRFPSKDMCEDCDSKKALDIMMKIDKQAKKMDDHEFFIPTTKENDEPSDVMKTMALEAAQNMILTASATGTMLPSDRAMEAAEIMLGIKKSPTPHQVFTPDSPSGWILPDGSYYPCPYMGHRDIVASLDMEEEEVEKLGWIKNSEMRIHFSKQPTDEQISFMDKLMEVHGGFEYLCKRIKTPNELRKEITEYFQAVDKPKKRNRDLDGD